MFRSLLQGLRQGTAKVAKNPQLLYTIFIALLITGSFIYMAERFIGIAQTAEERLINVRVGSIQDAFVSFAGEKLDDTAYLNEKIKSVIDSNETIENFKIVVQKPTATAALGTTTAYIVIASNDTTEIGQVDTADSFLYTLAAGNPQNSLTTPEQGNGERLFKTSRAIVDANGTVRGVVFTTQTLSMADRAIGDDINHSRLMLIIIILLVLILFLRHSKIIDYVDLYKRLKEVDQLKDDFISMASHELRTPLTVIRGYAEFVNEAPELLPETKGYVAKIDASTKQLDVLISDILDVSKIEQGRMSFSVETLNPQHLVEEVVTSFIIPAQEKSLRVLFDTSGCMDTQLVKVDKGRLKQILINLVGNALKYTLHGDVIVKQYTEKDRVYVRVSDTGIGMTEEERRGLFGKFYRIKNNETKDVRGTGLGLWITAKMIEEMGGTISVESIKGVGSHFIVSFPLQT
jgi:signal transduction histidine kinase